jgi:predicted transcriptional regulator YdeE
MEQTVLASDKHLYTVPATSFPDGVKAAFDKLQEISGDTVFHDLFGISHMGADGKIVYMAAAPETFEGEAAKKGCKTFTVKKGTYLTHTIKDWQNHMDQFKTVFEQLLAHPDIDRNGACVEWYKGVDEVICMVRLNDAGK